MNDSTKINTKNYNYDAIKYFLSVASHGNLLGASRSLGISQSALSQSMKNLENSLNVKLFNRNTRGIILTEAGKQLYEKSKIGDKYFKEAIIDVLRMNNEIPLTTIKISTSGFLFNQYIAPIMTSSLNKYSNINFEFVNQVKENDIVKELQNKNVDLIIKKTDDNFISKEIKNVTIVVNEYCFSFNRDYLDLKNIKKVNDLFDYTVIIKEREGINSNAWIRTSFKRVIVCSSDENVLELTKRGLGIGLNPRILAKKEGLDVLNLEDYKPNKRVVGAFFLEDNMLAGEIVNDIIKNLL